MTFCWALEVEGRKCATLRVTGAARTEPAPQASNRGTARRVSTGFMGNLAIFVFVGATQSMAVRQAKLGRRVRLGLSASGRGCPDRAGIAQSLPTISRARARQGLGGPAKSVEEAEFTSGK
ncbi:hypothetical protein D3C71_1733980 [compost metagenome]